MKLKRAFWDSIGISRTIRKKDNTNTNINTNYNPIPSLCYEACNQAQLEAVKTGKVPALCRPDSTFNASLQDCDDCVRSYGADVTALPVFQAYIVYCRAKDTATATATATSSSSSLGATYTVTLSWAYTADTDTDARTGFSVSTVYVTQTPNPNPNPNPNSNLSSSPASTPVSAPISTQEKAAVIAPAIVVPVTAITVIFLSFLLFLYKRKNKNHDTGITRIVTPSDEYEGKPQLHSEDMKPELDAEGTVTGRTGGFLPVAELPAREVVGCEMDAEAEAEVRKLPTSSTSTSSSSSSSSSGGSG